MEKDEILPLTIKVLRDWLDLEKLFYEYTQKCVSTGEEPAEFVVVTYATQMSAVGRRAANLIQQYDEKNTIEESGTEENVTEEEIVS